MKKANQIVSIGLDFKDFEVDNVDYLDFLSTTESIKEEHKIILYFPRFSNYQECSNKEEIIEYWKKELGKARGEDKYILVFLFEPWQFVDEGMETLELIEGFSLEKPKISYSSNIVSSKQAEFLTEYWEYTKDSSYVLMSFEKSREYIDIFSTPQQEMVGCLSGDKKIVLLPLCDIRQITSDGFVSTLQKIETIAELSQSNNEEEKENRKFMFKKILESDVKDILERLGFQVYRAKSTLYDLDFDIEGKHFIGEVKSSRVRIEYLVKLKEACEQQKEKKPKPVLFVDLSRSNSKQAFFSSEVLEFAKQEEILLVDIYELKLSIKFIESNRTIRQEELQKEVIKEFKKTQFGQVRLLRDDIQTARQKKTSEEELARQEWWKNVNKVIPFLDREEIEEGLKTKNLLIKFLGEYAYMLKNQYENILKETDFLKIKNIFLAHLFDIFYKDFPIDQKMIEVKQVKTVCMPNNLLVNLLESIEFLFLDCSFYSFEKNGKFVHNGDKEQTQPFLCFKKCDFHLDLDFSNLIFEKKVEFLSCSFHENIVFTNVHFKQDVLFGLSEFLKNADFHETSFDRHAGFYGVAFKYPPLFGQAVFKEKLNFVNAELDFSFEECKNFIDTNRLNTKDLRDSFRVLKSKLIDDHNHLDAANCRKIELFFKEIEIIEQIKESSSGSFCEKIKEKATAIFGANKREQKNHNDQKTIGLQDILFFVEQNLLGFYRFISEHHTNLVKSIDLTISYIVFNCIAIGFIKLFLEYSFFLKDQNEIQCIALIEFFMFPFCSIISFLIGWFFCGVKRVLIVFCALIFLTLFFFTFICVNMRDDFFITPFVVGILVLYFVFLFFCFWLLGIGLFRWIVYSLFILFFCYNPYIVAPILENSDKSEKHNYFMKEYIQNTDLDKLKGVVQQCEKLDRQIDWSRNQYAQIRQVLLSDSTLLLIDKNCAKQTSPDLSTLIFKNWIFNNVLKVIHVVYSIILALFVFSLIKTARKNSIVPS